MYDIHREGEEILKQEVNFEETITRVKDLLEKEKNIIKIWNNCIYVDNAFYRKYIIMRK
jgi:hypothetical protein